MTPSPDSCQICTVGFPAPFYLPGVVYGGLGLYQTTLREGKFVQLRIKLRNLLLCYNCCLTLQKLRISEAIVNHVIQGYLFNYFYPD